MSIHDMKPFDRHKPTMQVGKNETTLHVDFETFSKANLKKVGAHKYAMHPSTEILCMAWAFDDDEPKLWVPGQELTRAVADHIRAGRPIMAWNAQFERLIFTHVAGPKYGFPLPKLTSYYCIMVRSLAMGMPGSLDQAGPALGLNNVKDSSGSRVMRKLSKPRKATKKNPLTRWTPETAPDDFKHLYEYCLQDVRVEQAACARLVRVKNSEQDLYWRDQLISDRGVTLDPELIRCAQVVIEQYTEKLNAELARITSNELDNVNAPKAIITYLKNTGLEWPTGVKPSVDKDNLMKLLTRDDITPLQRRVLEIRQEAAKTSTAKLKRFKDMVCVDGTLKGTLQLNGASTGRDAGRGVQVQNFPRPDPATDIRAVIEVLKLADADTLDAIFGVAASTRADGRQVPAVTPMGLIADILRSCIVASQGRKLYTHDLSQIEARMTAYLAGQRSLVDAFIAYDKGEGQDIYTVAAAGVYNMPVSRITSDYRQVGKVSTLALGFGGGASAFGSMAKVYNVNLLPLYPVLMEISSQDDKDFAQKAWFSRGKSSGMLKRAWIACEIIKLAWRRANPMIVNFWRNLEDVAVYAVNNPGQLAACRGFKFKMTGSFLRLTLLNDRHLYFPYARTSRERTPWGKLTTKLYFKGMDSVTRRFKEFSLWGGTICQNIVQALSRDVMMEAVVRCEEAGYFNVMRVHDEGVHEHESGGGSDEEFHRLFVQEPAWAPGLPIAASGYVEFRYRK